MDINKTNLLKYIQFEIKENITKINGENFKKLFKTEF